MFWNLLAAVSVSVPEVTDVKQERFGAQTVLLAAESLIYVWNALSQKYSAP